MKKITARVEEKGELWLHWLNGIYSQKNPSNDVSFRPTNQIL